MNRRVLLHTAGIKPNVEDFVLVVILGQIWNIRGNYAEHRVSRFPHGEKTVHVPGTPHLRSLVMLRGLSPSVSHD